MSIAIPKWLAPWLIGAGLMGVGMALATAIRAYVQLRRAEYYIIREAARRTVVRASLVVPILALLTIGSLFIPRQAPTSSPTARVTATLQELPTPSPTQVTPTVVPAIATATSTPQPTATEPFIPTSTPQATLPVTLTIPLPSAIPPPADARFEFWTLAQEVDDNNQPVRPSTQFPEGIERIYLFFRYDGLLSDVPWATVWYRNGEYLSGGTDLWESQRPAGERYVFLGPTGGYTAGEYEVQIWLGDRLQVRVFFSVVRAEG
jgi:hypothetical protein